MLQTGMHDAGDAGSGEDVPSASEIQERLEDAISLARTGHLDHTHQHPHPNHETKGISSISTAVNPTPSTLRNRKPSTIPSPGSDGSTTRGAKTPMVKLRRLEADDPRAIEFREKMRNWYAPLSPLHPCVLIPCVGDTRFGRVPWHQITRQDVLHWLAWSCCNLPYEAVSESAVTMTLLEASVELLEARTGTTFVDPPAGGGGSSVGDGEVERKAQARVRDVVKLMRLTLDPVNTRTRPLFIYAARALADKRLRGTVYRQMGFEVVSFPFIRLKLGLC